MKSNTSNDEKVKHSSIEKEIDLLGLVRKIWASRKLIFKVCTVGVILGLVIGLGIPKEYTANILIIPESNSKKPPSSSVSALAAIVGVNLGASSGTDAVYPSLYPKIVYSTPFLVGLFHLPVHMQKDSTMITLAEYMRGHQKSPWWKNVTSVPSRIVNQAISLFKDDQKVSVKNREIDLFRLTPAEAGMASAIRSRITILVDKKTLMITIAVTMQDPLIAATVADSVRIHLQEYITEYRTRKARLNLEYVEKLNEEAHSKYYDAQAEYARYADTNQGLVMQKSRAELERLQHEKKLAYTIYNQVSQQMSLAKAKVEEVTPVYTIIQPVTLPLSASKPRRALIIAVCILLGGTGGIGWALFGKDVLLRIEIIKNNGTRLSDSRTSYPNGRRQTGAGN